MGRFTSYTDLCRYYTPGTDFIVQHRVVQSRYAIIAPHGGWLERGTRQIAAAIAAGDHGYYCFNVLNRKRRSDFHISSNLFDEPVCLDMAGHYEKVVTVHGARGSELAVYGGGLDAELRNQVLAAVRGAGIPAAPDPSPTRQGKGATNICNRCRSARGVQLELTQGLRRAMFVKKPGGIWYPGPLFTDLVLAVRGVLA